MKNYLLPLIIPMSLCAVPEIPHGRDTLRFLKKNSVDCNNLRLHLGCGETHLKDYINIDFAPDEHPLQSRSGADFWANIRQLSFPTGTVTEVRSHHTFEHFNRQIALALLAGWNYWLRDGGTITIETPDFQESMKQLLSTDYSYTQKQIIMRHIFGSHEASWANHYDGWYDEKFRHILYAFGFTIQQCEQSSYLVLRNITIRATKNRNLSVQELKRIGHEILSESMTDRSGSEHGLWQIWCNEFDRAVDILCHKS
jgi:predicted SAM-dependent methyltransferase